MHQSNDLCLITGCERRTSPDSLRIRSQIFIINPSPRMKVMAVSEPRQSAALLLLPPRRGLPPLLPSSLTSQKFRGNRSSLIGLPQEVDLECLSICVGRAEKKQHHSGREAKTLWSTSKPLWFSLSAIKAENINTGRTACIKSATNSHKCVLGHKPGLSGFFHKVISNFRQRLCETWLSFSPLADWSQGVLGVD